jgi:hypothetical protein
MPRKKKYKEVPHNYKMTLPKEFEGIPEEESMTTINNHKTLDPQSPAGSNSIQTRQKRASNIEQSTQRRELQLTTGSQWI